MLFASPFVSYLPASSPTLLPPRQDSRSLINLIHFIFYGSFFEVVRAMPLGARIQLYLVFCINLTSTGTSSVYPYATKSWFRPIRMNRSSEHGKRIHTGRRTSMWTRLLVTARFTEVARDRENERRAGNFLDDDYGVESNVTVVTVVTMFQNVATIIIVISTASKPWKSTNCY